MLAYTEDEEIVEIPLVRRLRPFPVEPQTIGIAFQVENARITIGVRYVWRAI